MGNYWKVDQRAVDVNPIVISYLQQSRLKRKLLEIAVPGRLNDDEISSSAGVGGGGTSGMSFVVVGKLVYELARERGLGTEIPTNLFLQDVRN